MWLELARRIAMITLMVAFAAGIVVPAAHAGSHHHGPMIATVSASMDHADWCMHDGCPIGQQADMHGTCFASGPAGALAPSAIAFHIAAVHDILAPSLDNGLIGRTIPPDPHPPKQI